VLLFIASMNGSCGRVGSNTGATGGSGTDENPRAAGGSLGLPSLGTGGRMSIPLGECEAAPVFEQALTNTRLGTQALSRVAGDFDGDARIDFAFVSWPESRVAVLLGKGDGSFAAAIDGPSVEGSTHLTSADIDADGRLDLIATLPSTNTLALFLGRGDGTFERRSAEVATGAMRSVVGDWDGDGHPDLATSHAGPLGTFSVGILIGNGDGTFGAPFQYPFERVWSLQAGDFDEDGKLDLLVAAPSPTILFGDGNGRFSHVWT